MSTITLLPSVSPLVFAALLFLANSAGGQGVPAKERELAGVEATLKSGRIRARQKAFAKLAANPGTEADRLLLAQFERFLAGDLPAALWLDLFEAAAKSENAELKERLAKRAADLEKSRDPVSRFRECLEGGSAEEGRVIFTAKPEAGCVRCHRANAKGGEIGPDLKALGQATDRIFILESIIAPDAVITTGFPHVLLKLQNGGSVSGIVSGESADEITLTAVADGKKSKVNTVDIAERTPLPSAMPPIFGVVLSKRELRDLVEFIATME